MEGPLLPNFTLITYPSCIIVLVNIISKGTMDGALTKSNYEYYYSESSALQTRKCPHLRNNRTHHPELFTHVAATTKLVVLSASLVILLGRSPHDPLT